MQLTLELMADVVLWLGTLLVIGSYAYNSWFVPTKRNQLLIYQVLNLMGALAFIWGMYVKNVPQSVLLNVVWAIISLIALGQLFKSVK